MKKTDHTVLAKNSYITVGELRKALDGIPANTPVYNADHDHGNYETSGRVSTVSFVNQYNAEPWDRIDSEFEISGDYVIIKG